MRAATTYYEKGGRMPNRLLINIREEDFERVHGQVTNEGPNEYKRTALAGDNWIGSGFIEFAPDVLLWIYDGQHR